MCERVVCAFHAHAVRCFRALSCLLRSTYLVLRPSIRQHTPSSLRPALQVCLLVQRYAPDKRWYIDSLLQVCVLLCCSQSRVCTELTDSETDEQRAPSSRFAAHSRCAPPRLPPLQVLVQAGAHVKDDACRALILLVVNAAQLHGYAVRAAYRALSQHQEAAQPSLLMVSTWCLGEPGGRVGCRRERGASLRCRLAWVRTTPLGAWAWRVGLPGVPLVSSCAQAQHHLL